MWFWWRRPSEPAPNRFEQANARWLRSHRALEFHVRKHQCGPDCVARQRLYDFERLDYRLRETALE